MALTNAEKQQRHRDRQEVLRRELEELREELTQALEATGTKSQARWVQELPDEPGLWVPMLTDRLRNLKLIACRRDKQATEGAETTTRK